ncbi:4Fe-4S binding protein [Deferrisoma camini]|uniref:4Fe-4S binding protein n=1 Tax=Deferrisoma camini TaxID=1035120 RepID=UPI00046CAC77|nr:4Fe-4S binding protein [Deferrisoma camini]NOY44102.1 4Fe-4S dicluster domain-containing protein [Deltaproteobacteria bacterium]
MPKLVIRDDRCKGCSICVEFCPKDCLEITDRLNPLGYRPVGLRDPEACTGCAICARMCPEVVIEVWK